MCVGGVARHPIQPPAPLYFDGYVHARAHAKQAILITARKHDKLTKTHFFHHFTAGPVWHYVLLNMASLKVAAYAFGALINSSVQMVVFLHFALCAAGLTNAPVRSLFKGLIGVLQIGQGVLAMGHALYALNEGLEGVPSYLAYLQLGYCLASVAMFLLYDVDGIKKGSKGPRLARRGKRAYRPDKLHMRIHGVNYDCSSFQDRHPGGDIIARYHGTDATDAFEAFHMDSEWTQKLLKTLPVIDGAAVDEVDEAYAKPDALRATNTGDVKLEDDKEQQAKFSQEIRDEFFGKDVYRLGFLVWGTTVVFMIYASAVLARDYNCCITAGVVLGVAWAHCGFLQHHAGHVAVTGNRQYDFIIQTFFESYLKGGSARWWRGRHNKHHAQPNRIGVDGDLATVPLFAWDQTLAKKCPDWALRYQFWSFIPALGMYVFVFFVTTKQYMMRKRHWDEAAVMVLHWITSFYFFEGHYTQMRDYYITAGVIQGIYLGFFFGLSHFAEDRVEGNKTGWARWQAITAINWRCNCWVSAVMSGFLNLQIEHHMFPQCPPFAYPLIAPKCRKFCESHDIPYRELTFKDAISKMFMGLYDTGVEALKTRSEERKAAKAAKAQ